METKKEYRYRCFAIKLIEFIEKINDDDSLCDCGMIGFVHKEDCYKILVDKDTANFQDELITIRDTQFDE